MRGVLGVVLGSANLLFIPYLVTAADPMTTSTAVEVLDLSYRNDQVPETVVATALGSEVDLELTNSEIPYQIQLLQQEVQLLRGIVEELQYALDQVKSTHNDRYLELDGRLQRLSQQIYNGARVPSGITDPTLSAEPTPTAEDEKALYAKAVELIRTRQYGLAIGQLQAMLRLFPNSRLAPNVYYWLGEVYAAKPEPDYTLARQALAQVIAYFPDHRKVPDATFKLGKVYHLMGDCHQAVEVLRQIIDQYPGKSVARLADNYLTERITDCR